MTADSRETRVVRARAYLQAQLDRYAAYHDHKEAMAYAGITLYGGIVGAAVVSTAWPPEWGHHTTALALIASTLLWAGVLTFLRFQLTRRRWAALRVGGCDRVLASWLQSDPTDEELAVEPRVSYRRSKAGAFVANCMWGSKYAVLAVRETSIYPAALERAWLKQEQIGTDALRHERLILAAGWILYFLLLIATVARQQIDVAV